MPASPSKPLQSSPTKQQTTRQSVIGLPINASPVFRHSEVVQDLITGRRSGVPAERGVLWGEGVAGSPQFPPNPPRPAQWCCCGGGL
jgi:hypothetical protein